MRKAFPELPRNVFVIPPESNSSTYAAMGMCDAVLIYGTTTGVPGRAFHRTDEGRGSNGGGALRVPRFNASMSTGRSGESLREPYDPWGYSHRLAGRRSAPIEPDTPSRVIATSSPGRTHGFYGRWNEPGRSYAQNAEDVRLWRVFSRKAHGFYVDVGAGDPALHSVTKLFYDGGWSGVNIEPGPGYEKLVKARATRRQPRRGGLDQRGQGRAVVLGSRLEALVLRAA